MDQGFCEGVIGRLKHSDVDFVHIKPRKRSDHPVVVAPVQKSVTAVPEPRDAVSVNFRPSLDPSMDDQDDVNDSQTVMLPEKATTYHRIVMPSTPSTASTTGRSPTSPIDFNSPIFHAMPVHSRNVPPPIVVPPTRASHVSLTASQPGTSTSSEFGTELSSPLSPKKYSGPSMMLTHERNEPLWEMQAQQIGRQDADADEELIDVSTPYDNAEEVETPTLSVPGSSTQPGRLDKKLEDDTHQRSSSPASSSISTSRDFRAHASYRASNPFALDAGMGGWSRSPTTSNPTTPALETLPNSVSCLSVDDRGAAKEDNEPRDRQYGDDDTNVTGYFDRNAVQRSGSQSTTSSVSVSQKDQVSTPPSMETGLTSAVESDDEDDEVMRKIDARLNDGDNSVFLKENLIRLSDTASANGDAQPTERSVSPLVASSIDSHDAGRTGLASQLRARLAGPSLWPLETGSSQTTPGASPTSSIIVCPPARPAQRRVDSERAKNQSVEKKEEEMTVSRSVPGSLGANKLETPTPIPTSYSNTTNNTLTDIYSDYRGTLLNNPAHHEPVLLGAVVGSLVTPTITQNHQTSEPQSAEEVNEDLLTPSADQTQFVIPQGQSSLSEPLAESPESDDMSHGWQGDTSVATINTLPTMTTDISPSASGSLLSCEHYPDPTLVTPSRPRDNDQPQICRPSDTLDAATESPDLGQVKILSEPLKGSHHGTVHHTADHENVSPSKVSEEDTGSVAATAMARRRRGYTLRGEMKVDLSSAKNPVPIRFLLGNDNDSPSIYAHSRSLSKSSSKSGKAHPDSAFFPKKPAPLPATSFTRTEVPLPLHRSVSSDSINKIYGSMSSPIKSESQASERDPSSPLGSLRNSIRKRSLSLKRSHPQLRVEASSPSPPSVPQHALNRVKSEKTHASSPSVSSVVGSIKLKSDKLPQQGIRSASNPLPAARAPPQPAPSVSAAEDKPKPPLADTLAEASPISSETYFKTEKVDHTQFTMDDARRRTKYEPPVNVRPEDTDQWGFIGNSPVPAIYAAKKADAKSVAKLEQNLVSFFLPCPLDFAFRDI